MNKKDIILETTLRLVTREGFYHLNMKKLAQEAGVAAGTTYLYFDSKEKLINELYKKVVREYQAAVLQGFAEERNFKDNFNQMVKNWLTFFINHPDYYSFLEQYSFSPLLFKETQEENLAILNPLYEMISAAKKQQLVKDLPEALLVALVAGPLNSMMRLSLSNKIDLTDEEIQQQLIKSCWQNVAS